MGYYFYHVKLSNLVRLATDIETDIEILVKRLASDIRSDAFEKNTVDVIDMTRDVVDIKKFALLVQMQGAVQTSLKIGEAFLTSVRRVFRC